MKNPDKNKGFLARLDPKIVKAAWHDHLRGCARCQKVDFRRTATLAHCCPEGVEYIKSMLALEHAKT